jgi:hypothetical protein
MYTASLLLHTLAACHLPGIEDLQVEVHPEIATVLEVTFTQTQSADLLWLEYSFDDGTWASSPALPSPAGTHTLPVLGLPPDTPVEVRVVQQIGDREIVSDVQARETGPLPDDFPMPEFVGWDPGTSSEEPWLLTTVGTGQENYSGPFWVYIVDRQARVVWYHRVPDDRVTVMSRLSPDGTHISWGEVSWFGDPPTVQRSTLDLGYTAAVETPQNGYTYDELPDGTIAYDQYTLGADIGLRTVAPDGAQTDLWSCTGWVPDGLEWGVCGTNTVLWNADRGTYFWSLYTLDTVVEIDPATGDAVHSWGTYGADPIDDGVGLQLQHYPNWTAEGTLLLSTQAVGQDRVQWVREFEVDPASGALTQIWSYETADHYAECSGEAVRLTNGNTLLNYGCGGAVREVTPEGEVAWEIQTHELIGHQTLVGDLYAINQGPHGS